MRGQRSIDHQARTYLIDAAHADHVEDITGRLYSAIAHRSRFRIDDIPPLKATCRLHECLARYVHGQNGYVTKSFAAGPKIWYLASRWFWRIRSAAQHGRHTC